MASPQMGGVMQVTRLLVYTIIIFYLCYSNNNKSCMQAHNSDTDYWHWGSTLVMYSVGSSYATYLAQSQSSYYNTCRKRCLLLARAKAIPWTLSLSPNRGGTFGEIEVAWTNSFSGLSRIILSYMWQYSVYKRDNSVYPYKRRIFRIIRKNPYTWQHCTV